MVRKALIAFMLAALIVPAAQPATGTGRRSPSAPPRPRSLAAAPGASLGTTIGPASPLDALAARSAAGGADLSSRRGSRRRRRRSPPRPAAQSYQSGWGWGTWPYDQQVYDHTYYCAVTGDHITYRSTTVTTGGTLFGTESRDNWIVSGGIGYFWMVVHAQARFSCPTVVPWVTLHPTDWLETSYNAWGNAAQVGNS